MNPRTPASIVVGTLVTVSLFGLMQSMVREDGRAPPIPGTTFDPWDPPGAVEAPPPQPVRRIEERPQPRPTPRDAGATALVSSDPVVGTPRGVEIPVAIGRPTFDPRGALDGDPSRPPNATGPGGCDGGAPTPRFRVAPDYPRVQRAAGVEGEVEVALTVGADGRVAAAQVLRAEPRGAFEATTLRAVKRWSYRARDAGCGDDPVTVREVVVFRLEGVEE